MIPQGRDYGSPPYRHYDDYTYSVPMPTDVQSTLTGTITIRAMHQTTSGKYVRFLLDEIGTDGPAGMNLQRAFAVLGRAPPEKMVEVSLPILVTERVDPPDSGVLVDARGAVTADAGEAVTPSPAGCGCQSAPRHSRSGATPWWFAGLGLLLGVRCVRRFRG